MYALQTLYDEFITTIDGRGYYTSNVSSENALTWDTLEEAQAVADCFDNVAVVEL